MSKHNKPHLVPDKGFKPPPTDPGTPPTGPTPNPPTDAVERPEPDIETIEEWKRGEGRD